MRECSLGEEEAGGGGQAVVQFPSSHFLSFFSPPLRRRLFWPELWVLASSQLRGSALTALLGERGFEEEEEAVGLVCLSLLEQGQGVCQETCAMSLTLVWMSWRHSGHVSNCKAHSIHIPLQEDRWKHNTGKDFITHSQIVNGLVINLSTFLKT